MRISDAERDQVAEVLREAAAEGRITLDELDERLGDAYAARTYADLEPITADLPTGPGATSPGATTGPVPAAVDHRPPDRRGGGDALVIHSKGNVVSRKGQWRVPYRVEALNKYGATRLDFREAVLTAEVIEVHVDATWGSADLILPEGATAEVDVDASWFGTLRVNVDSVRVPHHPHFVVTGSCPGGSLTVRYKGFLSWSGLSGLGIGG